MGAGERAGDTVPIKLYAACRTGGVAAFFSGAILRGGGPIRVKLGSPSDFEQLTPARVPITMAATPICVTVGSPMATSMVMLLVMTVMMVIVVFIGVPFKGLIFREKRDIEEGPVAPR